MGMGETDEDRSNPKKLVKLARRKRLLKANNKPSFFVCVFYLRQGLAI
jgi:hypothetical protein